MATYDEITLKILADKQIGGSLSNHNYTAEEAYDLILRIVAEFSGIKRGTNKIYLLRTLPNDYVSFDIETTGFSNNDELIQVAGIKYIDNKPTEEFMTYVKTENPIPQNITNLTGITNSDIADGDTPIMAVNKFLKFIEDLPLIGFNISTFDIPRIETWTNIDLRTQGFVDILTLSKESPLVVENYSLATLKNYYGINSVSHDALSDSKAAADIYQFIKNKDYKSREKEVNNPNQFEKCVFCITGKMNSGKQTIEKEIISRGGKIQKSMSKRVTHFIVGPQTANNLVDGIHSTKELTHKDLVTEGYSIPKMTEQDFLNIIQ